MDVEEGWVWGRRTEKANLAVVRVWLVWDQGSAAYVNRRAMHLRTPSVPAILRHQLLTDAPHTVSS